jgi:hypothetical protein
VVNSCYGLPAESAAALLALARAAGIAVQPALLVDDGVWDDQAPQAAMVAAYVITFDGPDGLEIWHPKDGRVRRDNHWAGHTLLAVENAKLVRTRLPSWTNPDDSRCTVTGNVDITDDGKYTGKLTIKTVGLFVSPNDLDSTKGQKRRVRNIVNHLLPNAKIGDLTLKSLTDSAFEAEVEIELAEPLDKSHDCYLLELGQTSPAVADVPLPLTHSRRLTSARLIGPFDARVDLTFSWPEDWSVENTPRAVERVGGSWGEIVQTVTPDDAGFRLQRHVRINRRDLPPEEVVEIRGPLNEFRSAHTRTLLLMP